MGEGKRRKLLDPSWGETSHNPWQENKQFRKEAQLISQIKHIPDLDTKIAQWLTKEVENLNKSQQDDFYSLVDELQVDFRPYSEEWLTEFLTAAKSKTDPEVFEILCSFVLAIFSLAP